MDISLFAAQHGFPVVVKPRKGVYRVLSVCVCVCHAHFHGL